MTARAEGKAARERAPRSAHAAWSPAVDRQDPVETLAHDDRGRLTELLPIRYERMLESPFAFYRGAASIMARDLQGTPESGIRTQICGDAHLSNFGGFATPERNLVFDVNDFDETTPGGAWEWDVKRLAASVVIAGRHLNFRARDIDVAVLAAVRRYRERVIAYAGMHVLDVWYARIDEVSLAEAVRLAAARNGARAFSSLVDLEGTPPHIRDRKPLVFRPPDADAFIATVRDAFDRYRASLSIERQRLFDRFRFVDAAYKVVGVGSVGTRCSVALFLAAEGDFLLLQLKEARASVYESFVGEAAMEDHGERVVSGQRLMQTASDLFLGCARASDDRTYYVRQLHDAKTGADIERMTPRELAHYASICGWGLARAHAKAGGDASRIAGYLGRGAGFDEALAGFAHVYASQNQRDFDALVDARKAGRLPTAQKRST
ncbi:MAG: DUF2252 domain-containing protein [Candidatus Eremiobacteraeota bacterium]|nr:DUF2252 domain-containing protein [Candidatus Eremiobacteraeota bacterium]